MRNAKKEFITETEDYKIVNALIWTGNLGRKEYFVLYRGYSEADYNNFLRKLDFSYSDGYGEQKLFGFIGCENGIWLSRGEYDGSEWWEKHKYPNIDNMIKEKILNALEGEK